MIAPVEQYDNDDDDGPIGDPRPLSRDETAWIVFAWAVILTLIALIVSVVLIAFA